MKNKIFLVLFVVLAAIWITVLIAAVIATVGCQTTTSPGEVFDERGGSNTVSSNPGSASGTTGPPVVSGGEVSGTVRTSGDKAFCKATNKTNETVPVYLAVYLRPGTQHRIELKTVDLLPGKTKTLSASLPTCSGCEKVYAQIDCVAYEEPPEIYVHGERMPGKMLDNMLWEDICNDCPTPPCVEKDCPKDHYWVGEPLCKCVCAIVECREGYHTHPGVCGCFCDPIGDPECPEQYWDETLCEWVGECPCEEEECGIGEVWDSELCECVCEPEQCESGEIWNPQECECVCDLVCEPPWELDDEDCECYCDIGECPTGYELDETLCECVPLPICHVSNKGTDGNWNIQEQQKKFTPGHGGHMNADNFCPPDYFGLCDGRYSITPHPCMVN